MIEVNFDKITQLSKQERYSEVLKQAEALLKGENNLIANLSNIVSLLKYSFDYYLWVGFYMFDKEKNNLVLGPFQGRLACTRIEIGKGVCGTAFKDKETVVVVDVNKFPGHIFCDSASKSEIVIPIFRNGEAAGVLDVDSADYSSFDDVDSKYLNELSLIISRIF
ncbi:MAG: GAF domain-containing protein [Candidatus Kapaibacterium sp.]